MGIRVRILKKLPKFSELDHSLQTLLAALTLGPIHSIASPSSCGPGRQEQEEEVEEAEAEPVELNSGGTCPGLESNCRQVLSSL